MTVTATKTKSSVTLLQEPLMTKFKMKALKEENSFKIHNLLLNFDDIDYMLDDVEALQTKNSAQDEVLKALRDKANTNSNKDNAQDKANEKKFNE